MLTLEDLDKRFKGAQLALDIYDRLLAERGGRENLSVLRQAMARSAAVLSAMVEDMQARWLAGEDVDMTQLATLLNARRREAECIGLDPLPRDVTPTLGEYMASQECDAALPTRFDDGAATPVDAKAENRVSEAAAP